MIDNPVIVITGTSKGIGRYLAEYYSQKNFQVIGCSRNKIKFKLDNYQHFCTDVTKESSIRKMYSEIRNNYGRVDFLINNASVNTTLSPLLLVPYDSALETMKINLLGTFLMSREAIKIMMKNNFGRIINLGSMAIKHEVKGEAIYTASKAAVASLTKVMAKEFYDYGVTCNIVSPSAISTDMLKNISQDQLNKVLKTNAIPEMGKFEDVSNIIDCLILPESGAITGQNIYLGGV